MQTFRLRRHGRPDLQFEGELLADLSSRETPDQPRWMEIRIYRSGSDKYVTEILGKTTLPDEHDRITVNVIDDPTDVADSLRIKDQAYLTDLALDALETAHEADANVVVTERI